MQIVILPAFLAVFASMAAQTPRKAPSARAVGDAVSRLRLGMSQQQVVSVLGAPHAFVDPDGRIETSSFAYRVALSAYGRQKVGDVYYRTTATNRYEVSLRYSYDRSKSRLNPTPRLYQINFTLDRDMPLGKVLAENPIFADYCQNGCCMDTHMLEPTSLPESVRNGLFRTHYIPLDGLLNIETRFTLADNATFFDGEEWPKSIISGIFTRIDRVAAEGCGGERVWTPK